MTSAGLKPFKYIILLFAIVTSGFPFFYSNEEWIVIGGIFVSFVYLIQTNSFKIDKQALLIIFLFVGWEIFQFSFHGGFRPRAPIGTFGRFFFAYMVIKVLQNDFVEIYRRTLFFFALFSIPMYVLFYVPGLLSPIVSLSRDLFTPVFGFGDDTYMYPPNIILFNFHGIELEPMRNSGPFWEPGAFSVYLNLAIGFQILKDGRFKLKGNLIFVIALLTTLSTAGYAVFFFLISIPFLFQEKYKVLKYFFIVPLVLLIIYLFNNLSFLSEKVINDIALAKTTTSSRFGSALADFTLLSKHPIVGYGRNELAMYGTTQFLYEIMHRNNGLTKLLVQWGLPFGFYFLYLIKRGFNSWAKIYESKSITVWIVYGSLLISGFSQGIFQYPFFMSFLFMKFIDEKSNNN